MQYVPRVKAEDCRVEKASGEDLTPEVEKSPDGGQSPEGSQSIDMVAESSKILLLLNCIYV